MSIINLADRPLPLPTAAPASHGRIETWRQTLEALDDATRLHQEAFGGGYDQPAENTGQNPYREWWGGYWAQPGLTTLTAVVTAENTDAADRLTLFINGTAAATWDPADGTNTFTATLPSLAPNTVGELVILAARIGAGAEVNWPGPPRTDYKVIAVYVGPVEPIGTWPGVPSFGGTSIFATETDQLAAAIDWLRRFVARRTRPLFMSVIRDFGSFPDTNPNEHWFGSIQKSPAHPTLKAAGEVLVLQPGAVEEVRLFANGTQVATYSVPATVGSHFYTLSAALPGANGDRVFVEVRFNRASAPNPEPISHWGVARVWAEGDGVYPAVELPSLNLDTLYPFSTHLDTLNAYAEAAQTLYDRIQANPDLWTRQYAFSRRPVLPPEPDVEPAYVPGRYERAGQAALIRGESAAIGYGPSIFEAKTSHPLGLYNWESARTERITNGGDPTTALVYLDSLAGLYLGDPYNVRAPRVSYAGEVLRIIDEEG